MKPTKWTRLSDWGSDELQDMREVAPRVYQFVTITDMHAATGDEDQERYVASLALVDLNILSDKDVRDSLNYIGAEENPGDAELAYGAHAYGFKAPLGDWSGGSWHKLLRQARSEARALLDADALADAMDRPVNALGSTASEYMRGDFQSAMARGVYAGSPDARIMAKMHGVDPDVIDNARPEDWLPYVMGYMDATSGQERKLDDEEGELAPEYHQGYDRGERVKRGEAPAPDWIKPA